MPYGRMGHITGGHAKEAHEWSEIRADVVVSTRRARASTTGGLAPDPAELAEQLLKKAQCVQDGAAARGRQWTSLLPMCASPGPMSF
jgi:hypothetical protein